MEIVPRLLARLDDSSISQLFTKVGLHAPSLGGLTSTVRRKTLHAAVLACPDQSRMRLEGIAGRVLALAEKHEVAELALRAVCHEHADLLGLLESHASLEQRSLEVLDASARTFDRAVNVAAGLGWRSGRQHCRFTVDRDLALAEDLSQTATAILQEVRRSLGGRRVDHDTFSYPDLFDHDPNTGPPRTIHHIAFYCEAPASFWWEFPEDRPDAAPVLRAEAKEIAVDFDPANGLLDIAAKGVGGSRTLEAVARIFGASALKGATPARVVRHALPLDLFGAPVAPVLTPPQGFAGVVVEELSFRSLRMRQSLATFKADDSHSAYDRMRELKLHRLAAGSELVRSVMLRFRTSATSVVDARVVRMTLTWPNTKSFDGATPQDRRTLENWSDTLAEHARRSAQPAQTLSDWIETLCSQPGPMQASAVDRQAPELHPFAREAGLLRDVGIAEEITCPHCQTLHPAAVRRGEGDGYSANCHYSGWQPIDTPDATLTVFDREALLAKLAQAAGGSVGAKLASDRLVLLGEFGFPTGQELWTLAYADGMADPRVAAEVVRALGARKPRGLLVTPSAVTLAQPLPKRFELAAFDELFHPAKDRFVFDRTAAWSLLGRGEGTPRGPVGRKSSIETERAVYLKLCRLEDWPPTLADQARRIIENWPDLAGKPPKPETVAGHLSRHAQTWRADLDR